MGTAEWLAGVALVALVGIPVLLFWSARAVASVSLKDYARAVAPFKRRQATEPLLAPQSPVEEFLPPRWQYKQKRVRRFNPVLGRFEEVPAWVLVYE